MINNTDPLIRWLVVHVINSLKNQNQISQDCLKQLVTLTIDSNPYIRRMALISIINYIKISGNSSNLIDSLELNSILIKYFNDPHPLIMGTGFYAITELKNRDYLNLSFAENFIKFCSNLYLMDEFYLSRAVFSLVNFSKLFLFNNIEKNFKYIKIFLDSLYLNLKRSTDFTKNITYITAIYEIIVEFEKQKFNVLMREEFNIFKNKRRLQKIANILIRIYQASKNKSNENIIVLDIICKFVNFVNNKNNHHFYNKNQNDTFEEIRKRIRAFINDGIFFIKATDKPFIAAKKLEIIVNLVDEDNLKSVFEEFKRNLNLPVIQIKKLIIKGIYFICKINSSGILNQEGKLEKISNIQDTSNNTIARLCVEKLIDCLKMKEEEVISEVIISLRKLVNEIEYQTKYILIYCIKNFKNNISSNSARANIIWMICQYIHLIPTVAADFFRRILIDLETENDEVKSQLINLALKLNFSSDYIKEKLTQDAEYMIGKLKALIKYCLEKLFFDKNYHIREKARLAQLLISSENLEYTDNFMLRDIKAFEKNKNLFSLNLAVGKNRNKAFEFFSIEQKNVEENKEGLKQNEEMNSIKREKDKFSNFKLSLASKIGINERIAKKANEIVIDNNSKNYESFENLFFFDHIEDNIDEKFYSISLDDIINLRKSELKNEKENSDMEMIPKKDEITNLDKFQGVHRQDDKVKNTVENFDSKVNVEETRNKLKNQLDAFLNESNEEDEDEFEVEIKND